MAEDDRIDALYELPLDQFVGARNALVKELRASGDKASAKDVAALRKPSAPAWAVNRLARTAPDDVETFLDAAADVALAQAGALRGQGSAPLREAAAVERKALQVLLTRARPLLSTDAVLNRVTGVLRAAAADPEVAELVRAGRLTDEPDAPAFGGLTGFDTGDDGGADAKGEERRREMHHRAAELERQAEQAEKEAERLERRAEAAEREATERRQAADLAREEAEELRRAATDAAEEAGPP